MANRLLVHLPGVFGLVDAMSQRDDPLSMDVQGAADLPGHRAATGNGYAK